jgi:hypothetical protein
MLLVEYMVESTAVCAAQGLMTRFAGQAQDLQARHVAFGLHALLA